MKKFIRKIIMRVKFYKIYYINIFNSVLNNDIKFNELFYLSSKTLRYRYSNDLNPFLQYIQVLNMLQQDRGIKKGLEIGGGYSTILLTKLVFDNNCQITSIDINPNKYKDILPSKKHRVRLFESVEIVEDLTISYNTMLDFYKNTLKEYISEYNIKELQDSILGFVNDYDGGYISLNKEDPISYLFQDEKLNLFNNVLTKKVLKREKAFYSKFDKVENKGFVDKILENNIEYDFIFFDSGELSSLVEWVLLENQIKIGGYAILHDIYFPKSIKNFLVASFINISKNWEIVYKDLSTTQGMLVAKRVR